MATLRKGATHPLYKCVSTWLGFMTSVILFTSCMFVCMGRMCACVWVYGGDVGMPCNNVQMCLVLKLSCPNLYSICCVMAEVSLVC